MAGRWKYALGPKWLGENYTKREVMVPMRDGVRLYTAVYEPVGLAGRPVILLRTPYPLNPYGKTFSEAMKGYMAIFAREKYIIIFQNVRGQFASEGRFENLRLEGEAEDTFDTANWILDNCRTNGCIGVKGVSYPGFYATVAALCGHPSIKAVSPQAPVTDWWIGDDAHLCGAFQASMIPFAASFMRPRKCPGIRFPKSLVNIDKDIYDWFQETDVPALLGELSGKVDFLGESLSHPDYDEFWERRNPGRLLKDVKPAVMVVGGWYDAEDCFGAFETYRLIKRQSPDTEAFLVAGPWYHGGWRKPGYENLGEAWFGSGSAEYFLEKIEYPFFAFYLEGKGAKLEKPVIVLPSSETREEKMKGKNCDDRWEYLDKWPAGEDMRLYLCSNERLGVDKPSGGEDFMYISDPMHPVPYCAETTMRISRDAMTADQKFASRRTDVLSFSTLPLDRPLKVEGRPEACLKVSISGTDADIVVKLIDTRPDGCHMLVRSGVMPLRYRNSIRKGEAASPGESYDIVFKLNDMAHVFETGHRIMVQIQSSMFPQILMNPQQFVENPVMAGPGDYRKIAVTIENGSSIVLPVVQ